MEIKYQLIGNCVNSFDDNGDCAFYNYNGVSDFAVGEENATEITKEMFIEAVGAIPKDFKLPTQSVYFHDEAHDVYMVYAAEADIHYFWIKVPEIKNGNRPLQKFNK